MVQLIVIKKKEIQIFFFLFMQIYCIMFQYLLAQNTLKLSEETNFNHITIHKYALEEGLSQVSINDLAKDRSGFVWIATNEKLNRFDGNEFKQFRYIKNDSTSISGNLTSIVFEDKRERIWIGTTGNGLNYYDKVLDRFFRIKLENLQLKSESITAIEEDQNGAIWVATKASGLYKLESIDNQKFSQTNYLPNQSISSLLIDRYNNLWVGNFNGQVYKIVLTGQKPFKMKPIVKVEGPVRKFCRTNKQLFIGGDYGLEVYHFENKKLHKQILGNNSKSPSKHVTSILQTGTSKLWIGTGNGLYLFDWHKMKVVKKIDKSTEGHESLGNNGITALIQYSNHQIIVGTANGLNILDFKKPYFKNISKDQTGKHLLNSNVVFAIYKDKKDLWVGTSGGGLNLIRNDKPYYFLEDKNDVNSISGLVVRKIIKDKKNQRLWIATSRGLNMIDLKTFNPKKPKFKVFKYDSKNPQSISGDFLKDIALDQNNNLWGASFGYGVFRLELSLTNQVKIERYKKKKNNINSLQNNVTTSITIDKQNNVWIGSQGGLTKLAFKNNHYKQPIFTNYFNRIGKEKSLTHNSVYEVIIDVKDRIWVGTSNGLNLFLGNNKFESWNEDSQFLDAAVYGIQEDDLGNLWLGTNNGLIHFDIENNQFAKYTEKDGIQSNEFDIHACFKDTNGIIYMGGIKGISCFKPEDVKKLDQSQLKYFSQLQIKNKVVTPNSPSNTILKKALIKTKKIEFKANQFPFYLKFSSIDFRKYKNNSYAYKLLPIDQDWNTLKEPKIQFLTLPSGKYTLQIIDISRTKLVDQLPLEMNLIIYPPWYKTWWAYTLYCLILFSIIFVLYQFNLNRKIAIVEKQKILELDNLKSKMYANISHEFRTPLTLINGLSKVLLKKNYKKEDLTKLEGINNNGNQLLHLVNQMLELVSFDANRVTVSNKNANSILFIEKCVSYYKFYADSKEVQLTFSSEVLSLNMDFDDDKLQKILNNLLSNAIKFTPKNGIITVKTTVKDQNLVITVTDNGKGISVEHLPHIFERHYKTFDLENNLGSGIGMSLTKELVTILKGSISVKSVLNKGSVFTIKLPIKNTIQKSDTIVYQTPFIENLKTKTKEEFTENKTNKSSILLVEDNKEIQYFIKLLLGDLYTIHIANNGVEGLEIANNKVIDFIISDVMMPKMNGFEFCEHIKSNIKTSHIPFIIVSAKTSIQDKLQGYKLGIDAYLFKPFNKEELQLVIKNLLHKKKEQITYFSKLLGLKKQITDVVSFNQLDVDFIKTIQEIALSSTKISIDEITNKLLISRTQLHTKIKVLTGKSITHYINHIRIEKSKRLLKESDLQINEIAFELGFESPNYFSRIFKKEIGISPISYRETPIL